MQAIITPFCVVWMVTYNHGEYIAQAIESVLNQQTDFKYKLFIGDDKSNDGTTEVCLNYAKKYPKLIELITNSENIGANNNGVKTYYRCFRSGAKYVALIEGDDYWTYPHKLQKQVDFLEANKEYTLCFHRVYELVEGKEPALSNLNTSLKQETYIIEDLARGNFIHTPSVIFRNNLFKEFPAWYKDSPVGDYVLHMLNAAHGKIKYLPDAMAVYRRHANGIWSMKSQLDQSIGWVWMLEKLAGQFQGSNIEKILLRQKADNEFYIANCFKDSNKEEYFEWLHKSFTSSFDFFIDWIKNNEQVIQRVEPHGFVNRLKRLINILRNE